MIVCDLFELKVKVVGEDPPVLEYLYYTDLPAETLVIQSCERRYLQRRIKMKQINE